MQQSHYLLCWSRSVLEHSAQCWQEYSLRKVGVWRWLTPCVCWARTGAQEGRRAWDPCSVTPGARSGRRWWVPGRRRWEIPACSSTCRTAGISAALNHRLPLACRSLSMFVHALMHCKHKQFWTVGVVVGMIEQFASLLRNKNYVQTFLTW